MRWKNAILTCVVAWLAGGCGPTDACDRLTARLQACFGGAAAAADSCDPTTAGLLADLDCDSLLERTQASGKQDGALPAALRAQIRDAMVAGVKEALREALGALPENLLTLLGGADSAYDYYAVLAQSSSEDVARQRAATLRGELGAAGFDPVVHQLGSGEYAVLHDRCPQGELYELVERLTSMIVDQPRLVSRLGGELSYSDWRRAETAAGPLPHFGFSKAGPCRGGDLFAGSCVGRIGTPGYGLAYLPDKRASDFGCTYRDGNDFRQCPAGGRCDGWQFCLPQGVYSPCRPIPEAAQFYFDAGLGTDGAMTCLQSADPRPADASGYLTIRARLPLTVIAVNDPRLPTSLGCRD